MLLDMCTSKICSLTQCASYAECQNMLLDTVHEKNLLLDTVLYQNLLLDTVKLKDTVLKTMQFVGELTKEAIENIEAAKNHLDDTWYQKMQEIIEENKGKVADYTIPEGIKTDELADNAENRAIAEKNWEELERINKEKEEKLKG